VQVGGKITNQEIYGLPGIGSETYKAEDEQGHAGYGFSAEDAQKALERAQRLNVSYSTVGGLFECDGKPLDEDGDD
jgi:hypothetical protein